MRDDCRLSRPPIIEELRPRSQQILPNYTVVNKGDTKPNGRRITLPSSKGNPMASYIDIHAVHALSRQHYGTRCGKKLWCVVQYAANHLWRDCQQWLSQSSLEGGASSNVAVLGSDRGEPSKRVLPIACLLYTSPSPRD